MQNTPPKTMSTVAEFYSGKSILVTGATGFIGKVLLEKLLRSCSGLKTIYCLIRPKKEVSASERLSMMLSEPLFDNLHNEQPDFLEKVVPISGDVLEPELGISDTDRLVLEESVNVVFNSAATVRFDEHLRTAVEMNVIAVRKMIVLCKKFKNLECFLHVSTAYSNCERHYIEERVYDPPANPQHIIDALEWLDDDMLTQITPKIIGNKPNTYTYTKHLGEEVLVREGMDLPIAIIRPSIVTAAWREPVPGWVDNLNGPSGLYIAAGKGLLRSMIADHRVIADLVPVDLPVNMMIAIAWHRASCSAGSNLPIYHSTTGGINPFTWGEMESAAMNYFKNNPMDSCFRRPKINIITRNSFLHDLWILVSHLIPAYAADLGYLLIGKKPRMVKIYSRLHRSMEILEYFTTRSWDWTHSNLDALKNTMTTEDQKTFCFDPRMMHWPTYIQNYCLGTKKFVLKEDPSGFPAARAHLKKLRNVRYAFNTILLVVLWRLLIANSNLARNSWFFVLGLVFKFVRFFRLTSTLTTS